MSITLEDVKITATLARLHLTDAECLTMQAELSQVLTYAKQLQEAPVDDLAPTTHAVPLTCPMRLDEVGTHVDTEMVLRSAPTREAAFFVVPAILPKEQEA